MDEGDSEDVPTPSSAGGSQPTRSLGKAPKRTSSDGLENESSESLSMQQRKIIDVACWPCRRRKGRCSGERPVCASCVRREVDCTYEHEEGMTRQGSLRLKLNTATSRAENLQYFFEQLRTRPDNEAALLLAVIRLGADIDDLVERMKAESDLGWLASFSQAKGIEMPRITES